MRKNNSSIFLKKTIIAVCSAIFVLGMACFVEPDSSIAKAAESSGKNVAGCYYIGYNKENVVASFGKQDKIPVTTGDYAGWLFGGWFADSELTTPIKTTSEIPEDGAYAKFVNPDVLSLKLQVKTDAADATETNMRLVSTVDGLDYSKVGFEISYNNAAPIPIETSTVYKRIVASATSGVAYNYSPKVVGTESEYFVTATLLNVKFENYGNNFDIQPYWITYDGVKVYGVSKNATVNDGITSTIINATVAANLTQGNTYDVTYGTTGTATANVISCNGSYANVRITLTDSRTTLNSVTRFTIENGDADATLYYRNLETSYTGSGTSDSSWYDVYDTNTTDKYVIATSADLYGLEYLTNYNDGETKVTFSDKIVYLVADITVNEGKASVESGWQQKSGTTRYEWYAARGFAGTFDGQNHAIRGLYGTMNSSSTSEHYAVGFGLFTETAGATICNLSVENSYYDVTNNNGAGAIVGKGNGTFLNIYADVVIDDQSSSGVGRMGGIVGVATDAVTVNNCWSDSDITTHGPYNGGIVGNANGKKVVVEHCLNSGSVTYTGTGNPYAGGIVGRGDASGTDLTITDCLNVGTVRGITKDTRLGSILGTATSSNNVDTASITNSYSVYNYKVDGTTLLSEVGEDNRKDKTGAISLEYQDLYDMNAFSNTELSFEGYVTDGYWAIRDDNTPMLVQFLEQADEVIGIADRSKTEFTIVDGVGYISVLSQLESFRDQQNAGMLEFANGEKVVMTDDIEVNENGDATGWAAGTETAPTSWTAIKNFAGTFDGQGYTISGIYGKQVTGQTGTGVFTQTNGATIQNLNVTNSYFLLNTTNGTGGVVGCGSGTFKTIYTDVIMSDTDSTPRGYAGGIIGKATGAVTMENCWSNSTIDTRHQYIGGLIGYCKDQILTISHCLNTGNLTHHYATNPSYYKTSCYMGGLLGYSNTTLNITDSMTSGTVQSKDSEEAGTTKELTNIYATVGYITGSKSTISNAYGVINHDVSGNALGMTTSYTSRITMHDDTAVLADNTVLGLDYVSADNTDGYWTMRINRMPALTSFLDLHNTIDDEEEAKNTFVLTDNQGTISNAEQLASFRDQMNAGTLSVDSSTVITLTTDIVVNTDADASAWADGTNDTPTAWIPISGFNGIFDGGGYTISGLYSNVNYKIDDTSYGTGLFTNTNGAIIKNLSIINSYFEVSTSEGTGPVVGKGTGTIKNVYTDVIIVDQNTSTKGRIGGIMGKANGDVTIENCWSNSRIESKWTYIGGIVGYSNAQNVTISHCLNTGTLRYTGEADSYFGGIVGSSCSTKATSYTGLLQISDCLNVGTVSGGDYQTYMGGVIGNAGGSDSDSITTVVITNSYASINLDESNNPTGTTIPVGNDLGAELTNCESLAYASLLGEVAYTSTQLDFVTDSDTTGYWMAREDDTPVLKDFFGA